MPVNAMPVFAAVVEEGSFSAAAERLELSTAVVSKRVSALEKALGARLLHRTTRRLSLTEAGTVYYRHCARVVAEAQEAEQAVARLDAAPRGLLRVTAPVTFGSHQLAAALPGFLERYPEIRVEMDLDDRRADLAQEGYRPGNPHHQRAAGEPGRAPGRHHPPLRLCGTGYWRRHGRPRTPAELTAHNCLVYAPNPSFNQWLFVGPDGAETVAVRGNFRVNNTEAMLQAALGGLGVIMLTSFTVDREIAAGRLEAVLEEYDSPDTDVYVLYLPNRYLSTKARVFIDYLVERYRQSE